MNNHNHLQKEVEKKTQRREKKKHPKVKVSGKKVLELKRIISEKGQD